MSRVYSVTVQEQGGGCNGFSSNDMLGVDECTLLSRNIRSNANYYKQRRGYTTFADTLTSGTSISAIGAYTRNSATNDRLITVYNNKIYKIDPATETSWTEIAQAFLTSGANVDIVSFRDWMFIFNGVDKPLRVSNTTVTQDITAPASVSTANFLPAFGEVYSNSLFVAGVPTAPNVVFVSKASTAANPEYIYDFSGSLTSFGDAQELKFPSRVTGIRKMDAAMVIFTIDGAFYIPGLTTFGSTVAFDVQPISGTGGCIAQKACTVVENDIYYITRNKEIKSIRRAQSGDVSVITSPLSVKIQPFLDTAISSNIDETFSFYDQNKKEYYAFFRSAGAAQNDTRIVGVINNQKSGVPPFFIDDSMPFHSGFYYKGQSYLGSCNIGQVYKDADGNADDDDANIEAVRYSKDFNSNNPTTYKKFRGAVWHGDITLSTVLYLDMYVDDLLVDTKTIDYSDILSGASAYSGGIGTESIGDFVIGTEGDDSPDSNTMFEVIKRFPFRQRGRKLSYAIRSDGNNNNYRGRFFSYDFIPLSPLVNPVLEK